MGKNPTLGSQHPAGIRPVFVLLKDLCFDLTTATSSLLLAVSGGQVRHF
jgi:hypothetical protein